MTVLVGILIIGLLAVIALVWLSPPDLLWPAEKHCHHCHSHESKGTSNG